MGADIVEAVVQVRDAGKWIADVDIRAALNSHLIRRPSDLPPCHHEDSDKSFGNWMALETWDQVINAPESVIITKSHKNWVARLALAAVIVQHGKVKDKQVFISPPNFCGRCIAESAILTRNTCIINQCKWLELEDMVS